MSSGILTGKFVGVESIVADLRLYSGTIRERVKDAVDLSARELVSSAKDFAPVLQKPTKDRSAGELQSSIRWSGAATERRVLAKIGTDVFYGRFQESGWTPNPRRGRKAKNDPLTGRTIIQGWKKGGSKWQTGGSSEWRRNPRNAADWQDYLKVKGTRTIYARPFLKPALAGLRGTIRDRFLAAVNDAEFKAS